MLAAEPGVVVTAVDIADTDAVNAAIASEPEVIVVEEGGAVDAADIVRRSTLRPGPGRGHHHHQRLDAPPGDPLHPPGRLPGHDPGRHRRCREGRDGPRPAAGGDSGLGCRPNGRHRPPARRRATPPSIRARPRCRAAACSCSWAPARSPPAGGLGRSSQACAGPPVTVALDFDPDASFPGPPPRSRSRSPPASSTVDGSTWLVKKVSGEHHRLRPALHARPVPLPLVHEGARFKCGLPRRPVRAGRDGARRPAAAAAGPVPGPRGGRRDSRWTCPATSRRRRSPSRPDRDLRPVRPTCAGRRIQIPRCMHATPCISLLSLDGWEGAPAHARIAIGRSVRNPPAVE